MGWQNHAGDDFLANANDIVNEQARIVGLRIKYKRREKGMNLPKKWASAQVSFRA